MNISSCIDEFILYMGASLGRADNTAVNYAVDLAQFADYLEANSCSVPSDIKMEDLRGFLRELAGYGFSKSSIARKLSSLRGFIKHLARMGILDRDISIGLRGPRLSARLPRALACEDVMRMLGEGLSDSKKKTRDSLILELLYGSGLRVNELTSLDWGDVDIPERWLRVSGKGSKMRMVPFGRIAQELLVDWRVQSLVQFPDLSEKYPLFSGVGAERLTDRTVHRLVVSTAKRVGLVGVSPHSLRHSYATHMLERGAPLRVIQELLGHESLSTTQRYLKITVEQMKSSYMETHPRAGFSAENYGFEKPAAAEPLFTQEE